MASIPVISALTNAIDTTLAPGIVHLGVEYGSPVHDMVQKNTLKGKGLVYKKKVSFKELYAHGWRASEAYRPIDRRQLTASTTKVEDFDVKEFALPKTRLHQRLTISDEMFDMNNDTPEGVGSLMSLKMERSLEGLMRDRCRVTFGTGDAVRAQVIVTAGADGTSTTSTFDVMRDDQTNHRFAGKPGGRWLFPGMPVWFKRSGADITSSVAHIVQSVTPRQATTWTANGAAAVVVDRVTLETALAANLADYDQVVEGDYNGNAYDEEPYGLDAHFDDGRRVNVYAGLSRTLNPRWGTLPECIFTTTTAEGSNGHFQDLDEVLFVKVVQSAARSTKARHFTVVMNPELADELIYEDEVRGGAAATTPYRARLNQSKGKGTGEYYQGWKSYQFSHPEMPGGWKVVTDQNANYSTIIGFDPATLFKVVWKPFERDKGFGGGGVPDGYYFDQNRGIVEFQFREEANYICLEPYKSFRIERLNNMAPRTSFTID